MAKAIAILGTGSDVGKSIVATALCRIFKEHGISVAPFKAQNMSNNSFVTLTGGEMGRAQVVQAEACGLLPDVRMNPLLLKPEGDCRSQMILRGRAVGSIGSAEFRQKRTELFKDVTACLEELMQEHELLVIEGAGSCAELNLKSADIANFRTAIFAKADVILVADIDRGGVFAQLYGTLELLEPEQRRLVKGIVINKFRGDASLFEDGVKIVEQRCKVPVLAVIPTFENINIEEEDSASINTAGKPVAGKLNIAVLRLPRLSNFTDVAALQAEAAVNLYFIDKTEQLDGAELLILPGSKATIADMEFLNSSGLAEKIKSFTGIIIGICGGYQLLGKEIADPSGVEGDAGRSIAGLGLLDVATIMGSEKSLQQVSGKLAEDGTPLAGYEIHMGISSLATGTKPFAIMATGSDGAVSKNGRVVGTYIHGVFDEPEYRAKLLRQFGYDICNSSSHSSYKEKQYHELAEHFKKHINMELLMKLALPQEKKGE